MLKKIFDKLSNETHCVGLSFEKAAARRSALAYARTFASREVFSPTYMPPEKMNGTLFAPAGANSARFFRQSDRLPHLREAVLYAPEHFPNRGGREFQDFVKYFLSVEITLHTM